MKNDFWVGVRNILYFFGISTIILEIVLFSEMEMIIDSPYWALGAAVMWLLFIVGMSLLILGANLKHFPVAEKYRK
jgi:hypothetical protein